MEQPNQEICTIRIMFPVESNEQALNIKERIGEATKELTKKHIEFRISASPGGANPYGVLG